MLYPGMNEMNEKLMISNSKWTSDSDPTKHNILVHLWGIIMLGFYHIMASIMAGGEEID